jgi:hypothetical protein
MEDVSLVHVWRCEVLLNHLESLLVGLFSRTPRTRESLREGQPKLLREIQ